METLTWNEFKNSIKRTSCGSCGKVKEGPKECEISCIECYANFREWYRKHKDIMLIEELRKKINE